MIRSDDEATIEWATSMNPLAMLSTGVAPLHCTSLRSARSEVRYAVQASAAAVAYATGKGLRELQ